MLPSHSQSHAYETLLNILKSLRYKNSKKTTSCSESESIAKRTEKVSLFSKQCSYDVNKGTNDERTSNFNNDRESKRKWEKSRTEHSYCVFVINIAIITIIITQLLLLVFCQLAVFRHTLIMNYYLFSHVFLFRSILCSAHIMTFVFFVHFVPSSLDVVVVVIIKTQDIWDALSLMEMIKQ